MLIKIKSMKNKIYKIIYLKLFNSWTEFFLSIYLQFDERVNKPKSGLKIYLKVKVSHSLVRPPPSIPSSFLNLTFNSDNAS